MWRWRRWALVLAGVPMMVAGLGPVTPAAAQTATTLYVAQGGSDNNTCLTPAASCATITRALTQAASGATIRVSGTITNRVSLSASSPSPVTIIGVTPPAGSPAPSGSSAVVNGNTGSGSGSVFSISSFSGVTANLSNLTIRGGSASSDGGGIFLGDGTNVTVTDSTISGNSAGGNGGGIEDLRGSLTVTRSVISGNTAGSSGGGIDNASATGSDVTVTGSTISGNTASGPGGGISNGNLASLAVANSTISSNTGTTGGGIHNAGTATVTASTISDNTGSGGIVNVQFGAGVGGGLGSNAVTLGANIVAANSGGNCTGPRLMSVGFNLTNDATGTACGFTQATNVVNADPLLGPLQNNAGRTPTRLPAGPSPAAGRIPNPTTLNGIAVCGPGATDQRGVSRPSPSGPCTIGAVEVAGVAPVITSVNSAAFSAGMPGSFTVTTSGVPTARTITRTGTLPSGVTFTNNGNGTATLAGTPAPGTGGSYPLTITASNGVGTAATQNFTLTVNQAPAITSAASTTFTVGAAGTFTVTTSGFPPVTSLTESGVLPTGVTFVDNGDGTATLAGTPATGTGGSYPLTITADNGAGSTATQNFTLIVNQAPAITSAATATFSVGTAENFTVRATGFPTPTTITQAGTLPAGVTFTNNGNGTATLAGTPAAGTGGTYQLSFTASNGVSPPATQPFTLTVNEAPAITSAASTTFIVGTAGSFTVTTNGFPTPTPALTESGALPTGVTFVDNNNGTATLAGSPAAGTGGTYQLTITASNGVDTAATQNFTLTVNQAPAITSPPETTFTVGSAGSFEVTTTGFPTPTLSESGVLPAGVTFVDNKNGTATLAGTPAAGTGGTYHLSFTADNTVNPAATQNFTLAVNQAPAITSAAATTFTAGSAGTFEVTTSGFPTPTTITENGALPGGVSFTDNENGTATLAGTPAPGTGGTYNLSFTASNGVGQAAAQNFTLIVNEAPAITSAADTTFTVGAHGSFTVTTSGFPTATPTLTESGALPAGVAFTDNKDGTATLAGTPAAGTAGTYHLSLTADNGVGSTATQEFTLTVNPAPSFHRVSGSAKDVGAGANGSVWVVGTNPTPGGFGIWQITTTGNVAVSGGATNIAVDPAGHPWVTNSLHQIWRFNGHQFIRVPGSAVDVGVGANGSVWVVGTNPTPGGFGIWRFTGTGFDAVPGGAVRIAVDPTGNPWVTNSLHQIFRSNGQQFVRVPDSATDIGVGADDSTWVVGTNPVPGGFGISQITTAGKIPVSGGAVRIAVDPTGNPWVTNSLDQIFSFH